MTGSTDEEQSSGALNYYSREKVRRARPFEVIRQAGFVFLGGAMLVFGGIMIVSMLHDTREEPVVAWIIALAMTAAGTLLVLSGVRAGRTGHSG